MCEIDRINYLFSRRHCNLGLKVCYRYKCPDSEIKIKNI